MGLPRKNLIKYKFFDVMNWRKYHKSREVIDTHYIFGFHLVSLIGIKGRVL